MCEGESVKPTQITLETLDFSALRKGQGHKYDHGHALVVSGDAGRTGAARLAARAALRTGAGAVTLAVPPAAAAEVAAQITALMQTPMADAAALADTLKDDRISAVCIGPGLGLDPAHAALVGAVLRSGKACVLDADALTLIARHDDLRALLGDHCVLTPHGGEFSRLFPDMPDLSPADQCHRAAHRIGAVVLLKGATTAIGHPDGRVALHHASGARAVPWLATAGAGDVLAGIITGLVARGQTPFDAARYAGWLHVEAARLFGPGLIAEDLVEKLPDVFRQLDL